MRRESDPDRYRIFSNKNSARDRNQFVLLEKIGEEQGWKCPYTGIELVPGLNASLDHKVARSNGGSSDVSNLQWVYFCEDFDVNMMKRNYSESAFLKAVKIIYEHRNLNDNV